MNKKIVVARIRVHIGKESEFLSITKPLIEFSQIEHGNLVYSLYQAPSHSTEFIIYEEYESSSAYEHHTNTVHFKTFKDRVADLLDGSIDIQVF